MNSIYWLGMARRADYAPACLRPRQERRLTDEMRVDVLDAGEPTVRIQAARAPGISGARGARTLDLPAASRTLSQLSYSPRCQDIVQRARSVGLCCGARDHARARGTSAASAWRDELRNVKLITAFLAPFRA